MTVATDAGSRDVNVAYRLRWDVVERRCREMGAENDEQIAELFNLSRRTILRYKKGEGARLGAVITIAQTIGVRLDRLIQEDGHPNPPPPQPPRPSGPPGRDTVR